MISCCSIILIRYLISLVRSITRSLLQQLIVYFFAFGPIRIAIAASWLRTEAKKRMLKYYLCWHSGRGISRWFVEHTGLWCVHKRWQQPSTLTTPNNDDNVDKDDVTKKNNVEMMCMAKLTTLTISLFSKWLNNSNSRRIYRTPFAPNQANAIQIIVVITWFPFVTLMKNRFFPFLTRSPFRFMSRHPT